jgi:hypothetical protein
MEIPAAAGRRVTKYGGNRVEINRALRGGQARSVK